tara:strand:- start:40 stop:489 length:450 start_codon:yes stop_codon:yes gene_type:complete
MYHYLIILTIGVLICIYNSKITEGLIKCDINKPKVYNKKNSARDCQKLRQNQNSANLKSFSSQLSDVQRLMRRTKADYTKLWNDHLQNKTNIKKTQTSLNCKETEILGLPWLDCSQPGEDDDDDDIDLEEDRRKALEASRKIPRSTFEF